MVQALKKEGERLLWSKTTWIAFLLYVIFLIPDYFILQEMTVAGDPVRFNPYYATVHILGIENVMAYLYSFCLVVLIGNFTLNERRTSMLTYAVTRQGHQKYVTQKLLTTGIVSFIWVSVCLLFLLIFMFVRYPFHFAYDLETITNWPNAELYMNAPIVYIALIIFIVSLAGYFIGQLTVLGGFLTKNIYGALSFPIIVITGSYIGSIAVEEIINSFTNFEYSSTLRLISMYSFVEMQGYFISYMPSLLIPIVYWIGWNVVLFFGTKAYYMRMQKRERLI